MNIKFKWIDWNIEHIAKHKIEPEEAESVFENISKGYPRKKEDCYIIWGKSNYDRYLQIAFSIDKSGKYFIFHARPLTVNERRRVK